MTARYLIYPGFVTSKTDGQRHYINARRLAALYKVSISDCLVMPEASDANTQERQSLWNRVDVGDLIPLTPQYSGDYSLPKPKLGKQDDPRFWRWLDRHSAAHERSR